MKLNNNDDSHNSGLNLLIYNMLLDIESHPAWVCGLKQSGKAKKGRIKRERAEEYFRRRRGRSRSFFLTNVRVLIICREEK